MLLYLLPFLLTIAHTSKAYNAQVDLLQLIQLTGLTEVSKPLYLALLTIKKASKAWVVLCAITTLYTVVIKSLLKSKLDAASIALLLKWSITGTTKVSPQATPSLQPVHFQRLFLLLLKQQMVLALSSHTHLNLQISFGKIQPSFKMPFIKMVKKEVLLKCLVGLMLMSRQNVKLSVRWDGWVSKFSQHKSQ